MALLRHDEIIRKKWKFLPKLWKYPAASPQIPCDLCKATSVFDWLVLYSSMEWMKVTPEGGWGKAQEVRTQAEVHTIPAEHPAPTEPVAPTTEEGPQPQVRWSEGDRRRRNWSGWGGLQSPPQWDIWLRWLPKQGHHHQLGMSQPRRNTGSLWEARPPERSF